MEQQIYYQLKIECKWSLQSMETVLNPPSSHVLLHCVALRLDIIYYALPYLPESLHKGLWGYTVLYFQDYKTTFS